ncbi:nuclear pore complex protein NUP54 [Citrus sinensis]|uniref:Nuclear pore complex protein NUP54 n=1 Tax=Citrus sinensis TaxID=2711 RepID=A0ACB8LH55_CITSI|nr:nuclear pore complex protein NUP54 [Citrus sinensis]
MFGAQPSAPAFGTPSSTPAFGTPSSTPAFGTPSTSSFGSSLFSTPFSSQPQQQQQQQQQQMTPFQQPATGFTGFGFQAPSAAPQLNPFPNAQLTTQMAPVAPLQFSLAERDIQAIVDAYKEEPTNPKYAFKHLLFSVTEPQFRVKPPGVSDIMWAEAMGKLEGMDSTDRERLWPQLVQGFKDLSNRLKSRFHAIAEENIEVEYAAERCFCCWVTELQDEVILSDAERLRITQSNVKMVMRIVEALESKGCRLPLMKGEVELAEKLASITRQLKGSGAELSRRVQNLLTVSRVQANSIGAGGSICLPGSTKIHEQSLADMQEVLQQQTEAIARLGNVLKRDIRDMEIIMAEDSQMTEDLDQLGCQLLLLA